MRQSSPSPCYLASSKLGEAPDTPECCASILNSLEKGTNRNLITFSTGKHKVTNLNVSQQSIIIAKKFIGILCWITKSIIDRWWEGILPIFSVVVKTHLNHCVQLWASQYK